MTTLRRWTGAIALGLSLLVVAAERSWIALVDCERTTMTLLIRRAIAVALCLAPSFGWGQATIGPLPPRVGSTGIVTGEVGSTATPVSVSNPLPTSDASSSPCRRWTAITPSDSTDLAEVPKAIYVGGGGDLAMIGVDAPAGATGVTWKAVPTASMLPTRARRVLATGTTATLIVGCF